MLNEPIKHNSELGYYTNFMNLIDLASIAIPTQLTRQGMPFGITLVGPTFSDRRLLSIANRLQRIFPLPKGAMEAPAAPHNEQPTGSVYIDVVVCGAHLKGQPLNWQLTERGATLKQATTTAPYYKLYALAGGPPQRPGLQYTQQNGAAIEVEVWQIPATEFGSFVANIPAPLGIGKVLLADGSQVSGFICEHHGLQDAKDITHLGSWRKFVES